MAMLIKGLLNLCSPAGHSAKLSIFIFHRVLPAPDPLFPDEPCVRRFDQMMSWVADWFNVLPLDTAIEMLKRGQLPARAAAITFDDGYADNLLFAAPILKKHGLTATFFIATGFLDGGIMWNDIVIESIRAARKDHLDLESYGIGTVAIGTIEEKKIAIELILGDIKHRQPAERSVVVEHVRSSCAAPVPHDLMLTSAQLRELMHHGMSIGAHTVTHPILAKLPDSDAREEIANSREILEDLLKERIALFAYPNGKLDRDYLPKHASMVKEIGFSAAVTTNWGINSFSSDEFQLSRFTPWERSRVGYGIRLLRNCLLSQI
ncbi:polysaccharide deacetylase family protein [Sulfuricystis thermophila]|uniref:polysaccharide deacetylase family protein n=1 Tax=Sulfuricystis thermophila TaxID=2496847 RepID=UPI0024DF3D14|nr:polysaccharide deacetylase family protein [Sulfuricystis thermophila]